MTNVLITIGDMPQALISAQKSLFVIVQNHGLDSQDAGQRHIQIALIAIEMKQYGIALNHLLSAKYTMELTGGRTNPELANVLIQLAQVSVDLGDSVSAIRFLQEAKACSKDLYKSAAYCESLGTVYHDAGKWEEAVTEFKLSYRLNFELFGEQDPRTLACRALLDGSRRKLTERNVLAAREKIAAKQRADDDEWLEPVAAVVKKATPHGNGNGQKKTGKYKKK